MFSSIKGMQLPFPVLRALVINSLFIMKEMVNTDGIEMKSCNFFFDVAQGILGKIPIAPLQEPNLRPSHY